MNKFKEPVPHTCPDIDKALKILKQSYKQIEGVCEDKRDAWSINGDLEDIEKILEDVRNANDELRDWGKRLASELETVNKRLTDIVNYIEED